MLTKMTKMSLATTTSLVYLFAALGFNNGAPSLSASPSAHVVRRSSEVDITTSPLFSAHTFTAQQSQQNAKQVAADNRAKRDTQETGINSNKKKKNKNKEKKRKKGQEEGKKFNKTAAIAECLEAHNKWRRLHNVPNLEWDEKLAAFAQKRSNHIAASDGAEFGHPPDLPFGENLFWHSSVSFPCAEMIKGWYDEIKLYSFEAPVFAAETGHFTQVVWRNTKRVGCAFATSSGDRGGLYLTCNYDPPGNFLGEFNENVPRPRPSSDARAMTTSSTTTTTTSLTPTSLDKAPPTTTVKPSTTNKKKKKKKKKKNRNKKKENELEKKRQEEEDAKKREKEEVEKKKKKKRKRRKRKKASTTTTTTTTTTSPMTSSG